MKLGSFTGAQSGSQTLAGALLIAGAGVRASESSPQREHGTSTLAEFVGHARECHGVRALVLTAVLAMLVDSCVYQYCMLPTYVCSTETL